MSNSVANLDGVNFVAEAVDDHDGLALGEEVAATGTKVVALDLTSGKVTTISPGEARGVEWMSFADGWLAWPLSGAGGSSIQLWNAATHERRSIATSGPAEGVVGHGRLTWIEPAGDQSFAMREYDLSSGTNTSLDSGSLGAPVYAGNYLVWTKVVPGSHQESFVFVDTTTLQPVGTPAELQDVRGINSLAGSASKLVWNASAGAREWLVDDLAAGKVRAYAGGSHYLQFPQLADPYLFWPGPDAVSIVDLRSGIGFDLHRPGGLEAADDTFVVTQGSNVKGRDRTDVAVIHPSRLSPLSPC